MPLLGVLTFVMKMSVVRDSVHLVREPERQFLVEHHVIGVVAETLVANEVDPGLDPVPSLFRSIREHRDVVGHVVAVKAPDLGKARLQFRDEIGVAHHFVELPFLLHHVDLDPQVIDDQAAERSDRCAESHDRGSALDRGVRVSQGVSVDVVQSADHRTRQGTVAP